MAASVVMFGMALRAGSAQEPGLDRLEATRARPLFSPTRRPPPAPPDANVAIVPPAVLSEPAPPPPALQLSGVVIGSDKVVAIVTRAPDPKPISLGVGRDIDGWTVTAIRPRAIDIRRGDRIVTVELSPR